MSAAAPAAQCWGWRVLERGSVEVSAPPCVPAPPPYMVLRNVMAVFCILPSCPHLSSLTPRPPPTFQSLWSLAVYCVVAVPLCITQTFLNTYEPHAPGMFHSALPLLAFHNRISRLPHCLLIDRLLITAWCILINFMCYLLKGMCVKNLQRRLLL